VILQRVILIWKRHPDSHLRSSQAGSESDSDSWASVSDESTVSEIVNFQVIDRGFQNFAVKHADHVCGLLSLKTIESIPRQQWAVTQAKEVMMPIGRPRRASLDTEIAFLNDAS
jgi:hypothetical protein